MANKIAKNKKRYNFVLEKDLMEKVRAEAKLTNKNATEIVRSAIQEHLEQEPLHLQLDQIKNALVQIGQKQDQIYPKLEQKSKGFLPLFKKR